MKGALQEEGRAGMNILIVDSFTHKKVTIRHLRVPQAEEDLARLGIAKTQRGPRHLKQSGRHFFEGQNCDELVGSDCGNERWKLATRV